MGIEKTILREPFLFKSSETTNNSFGDDLLLIMISL